MKITIDKDVLYRRYIIVRDDSQQILAIDFDDRDGGLYRWEMESFIPNDRGYDIDDQYRLRVIGYDLL